MAAFFARTDHSLAEESAHFLSFLLNLFPKTQILWRLMADLSFRECSGGNRAAQRCTACHSARVQ
ncbi:hypothetical protein CP911_17880 [Klebsiella quasipneumoniae]|uniref:Uncharacterized protein n=1 Tax=Klebsiella quasipneumoniae TaxID=1463165 RepID=A0A2A5MH97_9ENTR|nr:hypothetical protein CP911_17880 [Klebsiella quasipneumoniae]